MAGQDRAGGDPAPIWPSVEQKRKRRGNDRRPRGNKTWKHCIRATNRGIHRQLERCLQGRYTAIHGGVGRSTVERYTMIVRVGLVGCGKMARPGAKQARRPRECGRRDRTEQLTWYCRAPSDILGYTQGAGTHTRTYAHDHKGGERTGSARGHPGWSPGRPSTWRLAYQVSGNNQAIPAEK